jgi:hypothetical protein
MKKFVLNREKSQAKLKLTPESNEKLKAMLKESKVISRQK